MPGNALQRGTCNGEPATGNAFAGDPIGGCEVTPAGFAAMTALLAAVAPLALILEGGYNLSATAAGVEVSRRSHLDPLPLHRRATATDLVQPSAVGHLAGSDTVA